jgi:hypothetical protein
MAKENLPGNKWSFLKGEGGHAFTPWVSAHLVPVYSNVMVLEKAQRGGPFDG